MKNSEQESKCLLGQLKDMYREVNGIKTFYDLMHAQTDRVASEDDLRKLLGKAMNIMFNFQILRLKYKDLYEYNEVNLQEN